MKNRFAAAQPTKCTSPILPRILVGIEESRCLLGRAPNETQGKGGPTLWHIPPHILIAREDGTRTGPPSASW